MVPSARHIAILEDDDDMRALLRDFLEAEGYVTHTYPRARQALESIPWIDPDAIISDIHMPGMNGLEFLERINSSCPGVPVIMITAFGSLESRQTARQKGAAAYLEKPFSLNRIRESLDRAFSSIQPRIEETV